MIQAAATSYPTLSVARGRQRLDELRLDRSSYPCAGRVAEQFLENEVAMSADAAVSEVRGRLTVLNQDHMFDATVSEVVHRNLKVPVNVAEDDGFWRWMAIELGPDVIEHRHKTPNVDAHIDNFGLGGKWENLFKRLWFRAELSIDANAEDPYELTRRGHVDFWASAIVRHRYSSSRILNRALIEFVYPRPEERLGAIWRIVERPGRPGLRTLYTRLRQVQSTVAYETLSVEQCKQILESLSEDLPRDYP